MAISELQNFFKTKVKVATGAGTGNIYVDTKPTPTNGFLVISPGSESLREIIKYTGTGTDGTGDYVTISNIADRGLGGTTAQAHAVGEAVRMNYTAEHQQEIDDTISAIVAAGAPNASTTVKGISKLSTAPADPADPIAVGDNDPRLTVPAGFINLWSTATAPTGWLLCNGSAVSRTTYADLFAVIGETYGVGDGSTTFNVPDLRSRFPLGYSATAPTKVLTFASRSSNTITVTGADNHAHNEIQTGQAVLYSAPSGAISGLTHNTTYYLIRVTATTFQLATSIANANAGTAITLSSDGTGAQTFTATYTARPLGQTGGEEAHALSDAELPSHTHTVPSQRSANGSSTTITHDDDRTGTVRNNESSSAGNDIPHNNIPLFTVVNYIIKT